MQTSEKFLLVWTPTFLFKILMPVYPFPQRSSILKHSLRPKTEISLDKPSSMIPTHRTKTGNHMQPDWKPTGWSLNGLEPSYPTPITGSSTSKWVGYTSMNLTQKVCGSGRKKKDGFGQLKACFPFFTQITPAIGYTYCPENLREKNSTTTRPKLSSNFTIPWSLLSGRQDYIGE